jgi:predicted GNAT family acetyltransferase
MGMAQRLYQLHTLTPPPATEGTFRPANGDDIELLASWAIAFQRDVFGANPADPDGAVGVMRSKVERQEVWLWETDRPVSMVAHTRPVAAVSRVQHVYTPPEHRNRGFAAACVAAVVDHLLTLGCNRCVLFTDLGNPTANAIYQRLGFTAVREHVTIKLGFPPDRPGARPAHRRRRRPPPHERDS